MYSSNLQDAPAAVPSQDGLPAPVPSQDGLRAHALADIALTQDDLIPMVLTMPSVAPSFDSASSTGTDVIMRVPHVSIPETASGSASSNQAGGPPAHPPSYVAVALDTEADEEPSDQEQKGSPKENGRSRIPT